MSDFKEVIVLLCKVLHNLTSVNVKPEYFRLAKFNKENPECREAFWQVVHKLCCPTVYNLKECSDDRTRCIVKNMSKIGYKYPHRITAGTSGHELLLVLGWLLWSDILNRSIKRCIQQSPLYWEFNNKSDDEKSNFEVENKLERGSQCHDNGTSYLLYLAGKVRLNMKCLGNCFEERAQLCSKIHEASLGCSGLPHLSTAEVKLIKDSTLVPDFMCKIEDCKQLLESYAKWKRKSYIFWEWMVSVLNESKKLNFGASNKQEDEEEWLNLYLALLKDEVKKTILTECKGKNLITKSQRTECIRMIKSSDDIRINKNIANVDLEIQKLEEECKAKEKELHENLAKLLSNRNDIRVLKSNTQK